MIRNRDKPETRALKRARTTIHELRHRLSNAEEAVRAHGDVEAESPVIFSPNGDETDLLRGTDRHYRALVQEMYEGALTLNDEGVLLYCNRRLAEMLKMPLDAVLGLPFAQLVAAPGRDAIESILRTGREHPIRQELTLIAADGRRPVVQLSLRAMWIEGVRCLSGVVMDVTAQKQVEEQVRRHAEEMERRVAERTAELERINQQLKTEILEHARAEEALRESESRFRRLAENAQDLIFRIAYLPSRRFEYVSPAATVITGHSPDEFYADPDLMLRATHPDDRALIQALNGGSVSPAAPLALRWIHQDGRVVWTEQRIVPLYDELGNLIAMEGIARDVTERREAEEALRASEERFRLALADSHITVFNQDRDLRYTWVYNPVLGLSPEEMLGKTDAELWPPAQAALLDEIKRPALEMGQSRRGEVAIRNGAETRVFDLTAEPRYDLAGDITGIICVSVDVTDRKQSEQALEHANASLLKWAGELEQRNREMRQLNEMGDLLQSCLTFEEAYGVIAQAARNLFPGDSGALYVFNVSQSILEAAAVWGEAEPDALERAFAPADCWALRRGRLHAVSDLEHELVCAHVHRGDRVQGYLCVPMVAQGETLGIFHLRCVPETVESAGTRMPAIESKQWLAVSIAEHVALALSGLRLRETLRLQAIRDPLTGLFNRRYMEESLERELRRAMRKSTSVGIVMLDLDNFKYYNDTFGHEAGDVILHAFGDFLIKHIRGGDVACRYGGEEFTLILPETTLSETVERAEQVRRELKALQVNHEGKTYTGLSVSLGIAVFPHQADTADGILRAADLALYRAKADGRDRVAVAEAAT